MTAHARRIALTLALFVPGLGCEAPVDSGDAEFRVASEFWAFNLDRPSNNDLDLFSGDSADSVGCLTWIIRGSETTVVMDVMTGEQIFTDRNVISTEQDGEVCRVEQDIDDPELYRLFDIDDNVLMTRVGRYLFEGNVDELPPKGSPELSQLATEQLALSFRGPSVFDEVGASDGVIATADVNDLNRANPMRHLLLGALVMAECGSNGLLPEMDPVPQ